MSYYDNEEGRDWFMYKKVKLAVSDKFIEKANWSNWRLSS